MKYMSFNSSCAYAGVANMLESLGFETEDRDIALGMKLPYLFSGGNGAYASGPMLQSSQWFDLYLNPIGFALNEMHIPKADLPQYLKEQTTAMVGLKHDNGGKHAVVFHGTSNDCFRFINNKRKDEPVPDELLLTEDQLLSRVDEIVAVSNLSQIPPKTVDLFQMLAASCEAASENYREISELCDADVKVCSLVDCLNPLFRPFLLDCVTMMELIGSELAADFAAIRSMLLPILRQNPETGVCLRNHLPMERFADTVSSYIELIKEQMKALSPKIEQEIPCNFPNSALL